jgi:hypothetical protein
VRVDDVLAENFAAITMEDCDGVGVDRDDHGLAFVGGADAEMMRPARRRLILPSRSTWSLRTR